MTRQSIAGIGALLAAWGFVGGASGLGAAPAFKLGTFSHQGRHFVGAVIEEERRVIDLEAANRSLERRLGWSRLPMASVMEELVGRYEVDGLKERIHRIVAAVALSPDDALAYVHHLDALRVLPPLLPRTMLYAAINYHEHAREMTPLNPEALNAGVMKAPPPIEGIWPRRPGDERHNPYFFLKPSSAVIADGEAIRMPPEREQLDWESELAVIIGRPASRVPIEGARAYVFGYTITNDVTDRGGRGDGRHGSDWLIGKGHDTFAPLGPFLVPKEFVPDPMNLRIQFRLNGRIMQDSRTAHMIHGIDDLLHYASSILTLRPGDLLATGSPPGVGAARNPPVFMKRGDAAVCWIERLGTLTNSVE